FGQFRNETFEQGSRKDALGLAERALGDVAAAGDFTHLVQGAGLQQAVEAGEDRVEEVQQLQGDVLVEEQAAVLGLVVGGTGVVQPRQQGQDQVEVLETSEVFGQDG